MPELLTTDEAATYLRLSERKLYELVANAAVPCSKVTGRWLFPKPALDRWVAAGIAGAAPRQAPPAIVGGSHDPLLERALRESAAGLAMLPEGSESGLRRLSRHEILAAAIHLHRLDGDDETANTEAVAHTPGLHDAVVIGFARRQQGLLTAPGNPLGLDGIAAVTARRARLALRPAGAGAQLLLLALLARAGLSADALTVLQPPCPTGTDLAQAIRSGRADCGIASRSAAVAAGLDFVALTWERFDLVLRQRDYFLPPDRSTLAFAFPAHGRSSAPKPRSCGGYDVAEAGAVRLVS